MKLYNINTNLMEVIESLYSKATSAVYYSGSVGEWLRITIGVRQGCLLSPTLFNIFLERIMTDALDDHEGGRQRSRWEGNTSEWKGLRLGKALQKAEDREEWRKVVARSP